MWGSEQPEIQTSAEKKLKKIIQYKNNKGVQYYEKNKETKEAHTV